MRTRILKIAVMISLMLLWPEQHKVLGKKPISVDEIIHLLVQRSIPPQKVAEEVAEQGVNFEITDPIQERLRKAGADEALLIVIGQQSNTYVRQMLEEQRREIDDEKKRAADEVKVEAKRQQAAIEARRKADEDARRREEVRLQAEERKQREAAARAERQAKEEADRQEAARRRAEEEEHKEAEAERNRTGEMVSVGSFKIDKTEVTVTAYRRCVDAGQCTVPKTGGDCNWNVSGHGNHPINCVDWYQAKTYCKWAGKRLPTEMEWERATRGTDGRAYPWGNEWDATKANVKGSEDGYAQTAPVGSFPSGSSPYGALDMIGNVWEWTADWYQVEQKGRSLRGGSWYNQPQNARASARFGYGPGARVGDVGLRCVR